MDGGKGKVKPKGKPRTKKNDNVNLEGPENAGPNSATLVPMSQPQSQTGGEKFELYCLRCKKKVAVKGTKKKNGNRNMIVGECAAGHKVTQFCK